MAAKAVDCNFGAPFLDNVHTKQPRGCCVGRIERPRRALARDMVPFCGILKQRAKENRQVMTVLLPCCMKRHATQETNRKKS